MREKKYQIVKNNKSAACDVLSGRQAPNEQAYAVVIHCGYSDLIQWRINESVRWKGAQQ